MEVSKRKLKLKMNMFVKRQNEGQIMSSSSSCEASSSPPCSCACWEMTQQLNEKVKALSLQMEKYGRLIREFEEIKGELLWEARGSPVEEEDDDVTSVRERKATIKEELGYDLEGLNDKLSVTEVDDNQDNEESQCGNDSQYEDSMDCVIVESVSLASTPDCPSSGESLPGFSGNPKSSGVKAATGDHKGHNDTVKNTWGSFEEHLAVSENSMTAMSEQGDPTVIIVEQKRKRRKRGTGGDSNPGTPTESLPDDSLVCSHCATGHVFKEKASLRRHIQHFHAEERKTYECVECNRTFQYKEGLAYHMRSVHEGIRHLCGVGGCSSAYSTITALRKHQRVVGHTGEGVMIRINEPGTYAMYKPEWENN